jgi:hypothetical protein
MNNRVSEGRNFRSQLNNNPCHIQAIFVTSTAIWRETNPGDFMETSAISIVLSVVAIAIAIYALMRKPAKQELQQDKMNTTTLRLQAYERLVLLTERISLPSLISRLNQPGLSAVEMKVILTENIKHEFEYNSTQQLYVSPVSWDSVRNLKEQNIMVINQVAATLPPAASSSDLNKKILEVLMAQPQGALHEMVLQALNFEAKKLMA